MRPVEAIIYTDGSGTRSIKSDKEGLKPMALIAERPFLEYQLSYLQNYSIEHVILSFGSNQRLVSDHFGEKFGSMKITYADEIEPREDRSRIRHAMEKVIGENVYILNGDKFFNVNLRDLSEFYFAHQADLAMTIKRKQNISGYGTIELDVCKVIGFSKKMPVQSGMINGGVYLTRKSILNNFDLPEIFSFENDFLEKHLDRLKICAMRCSEYFIDLGVPDDFKNAHSELPLLINT